MRTNEKTCSPGVLRVQNTQALKSSQSDLASLEPLLAEIKNQHGDALLAVLVYGSWLRGKRDTMLDFYVLLEDYRTLNSRWQAGLCRLLPPNVYHIHHKIRGSANEQQDLRAKYALLTLSRFHRAMGDDFHSYFWARFAQPCQSLYVRDAATSAVLKQAFACAAETFIRRVLPILPDHFSSRDLWTRGLSLTYRCELRTESSNRSETLYASDPAWYDGITGAVALDNVVFSISTQDDTLYCNHTGAITRRLASLSWSLRRIQGKLLSLLRLLKAAFTFNQALQYLLWKIERHSGLHIEPSARQIKHPLLFAWPLLWKLYRQGAFR